MSFNIVIITIIYPKLSSNLAKKAEFKI